MCVCVLACVFEKLLKKSRALHISPEPPERQVKKEELGKKERKSEVVEVEVQQKQQGEMKQSRKDRSSLKVKSKAPLLH